MSAGVCGSVGEFGGVRGFCFEIFPSQIDSLRK